MSEYKEALQRLVDAVAPFVAGEDYRDTSDIDREIDAAKALLARGEPEDEGYTPVPPRSVREPAAAEKAREHAEEIERLMQQCDVDAKKLQRQTDEIASLRNQAERYEKDTKRFDYWFGPRTRRIDISLYLTGMREGWDLDQWRAFVDGQIAIEESIVDQLPASGEEKK